MQAAGAIAELARQHANDKNFKSPYTQEALKQGYDVPWWEKIKSASFADGKFELGTLTVSCLQCECYEAATSHASTVHGMHTLCPAANWSSVVAMAMANDLCNLGHDGVSSRLNSQRCVYMKQKKR